VNLTAQLGNFPSGTKGFEIAQIRYAAVPEPSTLVLSGISLTMVGGTIVLKHRRS
jgi:hypothetical protein